MTTSQRTRMSSRLFGTVAATSLGLIAACGGSSDPLSSEEPEASDGGGTSTIVIGSQDYYSNEIIAEIYAQVLEANDFTVQRQYRIGQRDSYLAAMEAGEVDLLPEYAGNLLQYYDDQTPARSPQDVTAALPSVLPESLAVLGFAPAQDADSYNVTAEFSQQNQITSLADLADYDGDITIGGNAELQERPYGPKGLKEFYNVDTQFTTIGDSGGPLTKEAIKDGTITMGDIYTADPDLSSSDFVTLEDPQNMILAQNVIPLVDASLVEKLAPILDPINDALTTEVLRKLNGRSVNEQLNSATIAKDWLRETGLN